MTALVLNSRGTSPELHELVTPEGVSLYKAYVLPGSSVHVTWQDYSKPPQDAYWLAHCVVPDRRRVGLCRFEMVRDEPEHDWYDSQ